MERLDDKTLTDYIVIAISPALIALLVGSFVYFLLTVMYVGPYDGRLRWTFGFFILGAVGIGRISIEQGREHAALFALPLGLATMLAVSMFVKFPFLANLAIVLVIWFSADRLTWDCTVIDEQEDASGEGLVSHLGPEKAATEDATDKSGKAETVVSRWQKFVAHRRQRHVPGLWVIYLSLIALPAFGVLHGLIPDRAAGAQSDAFRYLVVYVASALALLMTTSFLNLRRYLRQRHLEMPTEMAGVWLGVGGALIAGIVIFCILLPRPAADRSLLDLAMRLTSDTDQKATPHAPGKEGVDQKGQGADTEKAGREATQGRAEEGDSSANTSQEAASEGESASSASAEKSDAASASEPTESSQNASQSGGKESASQPPTPPTEAPPGESLLAKLGEWAATLFRWLLLAAVIGAGLYWAWINRVWVMQQWRKFLEELWNFWHRLFGRPPVVAVMSSEETQAPPTPFTFFRNPFLSGDASRLGPEQLVRYTFEALEAWAQERGCGRCEHQTPQEFSRQLAQCDARLAKDAAILAELYNLAAYAGHALPSSTAKHLQRMWQTLDNSD